MDLWLIFLTGLTIGGLTCMAVQGGLLASTIAAREEEEVREGSNTKNPILPTLSFLITKLVAYTALGFLLGAFGGALQLTDNMRLWMQIFAGIYMIVIALNLLNVHPIFRYSIIQPPRFLFKLIRNRAKSKDIFAPAFLGGLTIFIPCGTTLAMEALAISSGNALSGALIMGVFILGTSPLFFGLGYITSILGDKFRENFLKLAAILVLYLGLSTINGSLVLAGSSINFKELTQLSPIQIDLDGEVESDLSLESIVKLENGIQVAQIKVLPTSYNPDYIQVKSKTPVKLDLISEGGYGCTSQFLIPQLGISKNIPNGGQAFVEFTPIKTGKLTWTCSMGMYTGIIEVI